MAGAIAVNGNTAMNNVGGITFPGAVTIAASTTFTNNGTVSISGALDGANATTSIWVNASGSNLTYGSTAAPMATGVLTASASSNTVNYTSGAQTIEGTDYNTLILGGASVTKTLNGITTIANAFTIPSTITLANSTFSLTLPNVTINSGGILSCGAGNIIANGTITNNGTVTSGGGTFTVAGAITNGGTFSLGAGNFTASSTITNNSIFNDVATAGTNIFTGLFTNSGTFSTTNNPTFDFRGGLTNNGTMAPASTGAYTFSTNTQTVSGSNPISIAGPIIVSSAVTFNNSVAYNFSSTFTINTLSSATFTGTGSTTITGVSTLNGNLTLNAGYSITHTGAVTIGNSTTYLANAVPTFSAALNGTSGTSVFTLGAGLTFTYAAATAPMAGGVFDASASGTTVNYSGAAQTIAGGIYNNLILSGTLTKTLGGNVTVNNTFTIPSPITLANSTFTLTIPNTTINSGGTLSGGSGNIIANGTIINNGTVSAGAGAFTVAGAITNGGNFTLGSGNFTASSTFTNNLTFNDGNVGGTNIFTGLFTNAGTFTNIGNAPLEFRGGLTNNGTLVAPGTGTITFSTNTQTVTGTNPITFTGPVNVSSNVTFNNSSTYTFAAFTTISGGLSTFSGSGNFTFASFTTNATSSSVFAGTGTNTVTGTSTFNGNFTLNAGSAITHTGAVNIGDNTTYLANGTPTIGGALTGATGTSVFTLGSGLTLVYTNAAAPMVGGVFDASATGTTVNYSGAAQTIAGGIYNNLVLSGSNTKTLGGNTTVNNALIIPTSITLALAAYDFNALSTIVNNGTFSDASATGTNIITGLFTNSGTFIISNSPSFEFRGGITNSGTMTLPNGTFSFTTNNQTINATNPITFPGAVNVGANVTVNLNGTSTIVGILNGTNTFSTFSLGASSTLNYSNANAPMLNGQLNATALGSTVHYNGAAQTIIATTYHHISFTGSPKTIPDITVNGDFTRNGNINFLFSGSSLAFKSSNSSVINVGSTNLSTFPNVVIDKTLAASVTLVNPSLVAVTFSSLSIPNGTFSLGASNTSLTVTNDLGGVGTLDMSGATHTLILIGVNNSIGTLNSAAAGTVTYNRVGNQNMIATPNYRNVTLSGLSSRKSLSGPSTISGVLNLSADLFLNLGGSDLILTPTATLSGTFSATRMILTDGIGNFIKQGTTVADFTTDLPGGVYPLGTGVLYTPFTLSSLTASITSTGAISVRAVPQRQPNVPYYNNATAKYWKIETTNISIINANASFQFNSSEAPPPTSFYEPRVWNGSTLSTVAGPSAQGNNPFSTTGTTFLAGEWTAVDPTIRTTLYSYQSGDWANLNTWTTDPSGSTLVSSIIPGNGDQVVILPGRTVTTAISRTIGQLEVQSGGVLDLGTTITNNLGIVSGEGTIRLKTINFPSGNFAAFTASTGGTVEYYDLPSGTNVFSNTQVTYNNLYFTNNSGTAYTVNTNSDLTINGDYISSRNSGNVSIIIGNTATAWSLLFNKNVTINTGTSLLVANYNATHDITIAGNLSVDGTLTLTNGAANANSTAGACITTFRGATLNTTATFGAGANVKFYDFITTKNDGYELYVSSSPSATVLFHGRGNVLNPTLGTLRLGANLTIPVLATGGGNYDLGAPGILPVLWIDGAIVTYAGGGALVPYGTFRISSGSFTNTSGQGAVVIRESGLFQIDGGVVNMSMFRTSVTAATHRGSFVMNGGTLSLSGNLSTESGYYSIFSLPYPENVFKMTGGTINITRVNGGSITPNGGIMIASTSQNFLVTGGTINVNITGNQNFDITSTAPFYDLNVGKVSPGTGQFRLNAINWSFDGGAGNTATITGKPLTVLNNFTVTSTNSPTFNSNGFDVNVGKDFTLNTSSTYTSGLNTLTFNGNTAQSFIINGTITAPGVNNLTVNKAGSSVLTIAGSATSLTATGGLNLLNGTLADNGKTINVAGNIVNNATHSGTGKISLNGAVAQTIGGLGNGVFQNLEIAGGPTAVNATNTVRVNGNLNLATNRIFNISIYRLILQATSAITGTFSSSRFIATEGFQSDGGIVKPFNSTAAFLFPFGTGTNYTPATIQFSSAPTAYGTIDVRPVPAKQLYVTDAPNALTYYWKVRQTGFSGVPANSVNFVFNYGNLPDNTTYIPGYYNYQSIAFTTINDVTKVNETSKNINFDNVSYFSGDFTAGAPSAFGIVLPYYSRANGAWNNNTTWSNVGYGGAIALGTPSASVPVFIGDGTTYFHTVTVTANNTVAGSLIVDAGSTLDLGVTTGHNFGALPYSTAGGAGTIRISSATPIAQFPAGDFGIFFTSDGGTTDYYTSGATSFDIPLTTIAPTNAQIRSYKNLILTPSAGLSVKLPNRDLEILQNITVNGNAAGVALLNDASSKTLTVRGNTIVNSGILRFPSAFAQTIQIDGDFTIAANGTSDVVNAGTSSNIINLSGNLTNNGVISYNQASKTNINFIGNIDKAITGTNGSASTTFNNITVNKGIGKTTVLNVDAAGALIAPNNNWLTLQNGTFRISKATTLTLTNTASNSFLIPTTSTLSINHASAIINVANVDDDNAELILGGKLEMLNGTLNIGNVANNRHNDLEYAGAGSDLPELDIRGNSILNVNGQIRRSVSVQLGSLVYSQRNNSVVLVRGRNAGIAGNFNLNRAKFEITNPSSQFNMSENALLVIDRNGLASGIYGDAFIDPEISAITGGEIVFGTSFTPSAEGVFSLYTTVPLWNVTVDGTSTGKTVRLINNPLTTFKNLTIGSGSIFNANSLNVTIGGNLINQNTTSATGLNIGGYQVIGASQVTTFNSNNSNQTITGVSGNLTNFANLVVNNTFSSGTLSLSASSNIRVNGNLSAISANINGSNNNITVTGDVLNNVSISNTGAGYFIANGASNQTFYGSNGTYGNIRLSNAAGVDLVNPLTITGDLNFVNGLFYINNNLLTLTETATVSGALNASSMIRLNGVLSDAGVRKLYPASAHNFTFPVGITLKYTPVSINATSNSTAGSVTIKAINTKHPATTDPLNKELTYYWNTSSTGFSGSSVFTHIYNFINSDAINGTESLYNGGRFFNNVWTPQFGITGTVNATANTITLSGVNYLNGDYTAGEQSEFDQLLIFYSRNATLGGNWNDVNSWSTDQVLQHAGPAAGTFPNSNTIIIAAGHTIVGNTNNLSSPIATINGTLNLNNTIGHNFGTVSGTGTIRMTPTVANQFIFPGGNYSAFVNAGGGTFEYNANATAALPSQSTYNNVTFTGTGSKTMANSDLLINGNWNVSAGNVTNTFNNNISLLGNYTSNPGIPGFTVGTGTFSMAGSTQVLNGSTNFYRLNINGAGIKTFNAPTTVTQELLLNNGIIATGSNTVSLSANATITGGSASSYVNGLLQRSIPSAASNRAFPIGSATTYAPVNISFVGTTNGTGSITLSTTNGDNSNIDLLVLDGNKSANRFYTITNSGVTFTTASVAFNFAGTDLDMAANPLNFVVGKFASSVWSYPTVGTKTSTSTQVTGLTAAQLSGVYQLAELYTGGIVWNGSISADWNNTGNWTPPAIPTIADDITIAVGLVAQPSFITGGNGFCKNITFDAGANMTVPSSKMLTIAGNVTSINTSIFGNGTVKITSPAAINTGTLSVSGELSIANGANLTTNNNVVIKSGGSLMHGIGTLGAGGTVTGAVRVERTGSSSNNYNYWSSPITAGSTSSLGGNRYFYNPSAATGTSVDGLRAGWISTNGAMTNGRGYIATGSGTVGFNGTANNGNITYGPLSIGTFTNCNLIGNPYPSGLSASSFVAANPQIAGGALYFWDDDGTQGSGYSSSDYAVWNGLGGVGPNSGTVFTGNVATAQGFFINALNTNPIQFNNTMRTAVNNVFFEDQAIERLWINVTTAENEYNETLIAFREDATDDADNQYDAKKMRGNEKIALYSIIGTEDYAIQALPSLTADKMLPLGIEANVSGPQTIKLKQIEHIPASAQVILEDTKLGVFQNLRSNPIYVYNYETGVDVNRFRLHFKPAVTLFASTESCAQNDGTITLNSNSATTWNYSVVNSNGVTLASAQNFSGNVELNNLSGGIYTVNLSNQFGTYVQEMIEVQSGSGITASVNASAIEVELNEESIEFTANVNGATDITWDFGDGTIVTGVLNPIHFYTNPGTYTVNFVASNANCMDVKTILITVLNNPTGIDQAEKQAFNIYPNPASDYAVITLNLPEKEKVLTLHLIDEAGKIIKTEKYEQLDKKASVTIPVSDLAAGVYQILIQGNQFSSASRLTIVH
jgi:hypothetical protein